MLEKAGAAPEVVETNMGGATESLRAVFKAAVANKQGTKRPSGGEPEEDGRTPPRSEEADEPPDTPEEPTPDAPQEVEKPAKTKPVVAERTEDKPGDRERSPRRRNEKA